MDCILILINPILKIRNRKTRNSSSCFFSFNPKSEFRNPQSKNPQPATRNP